MLHTFESMISDVFEIHSRLKHTALATGCETCKVVKVRRKNLTSLVAILTDQSNCEDMSVEL